MSYDNFKDPVGLLKRMLLSGNRAAYFTIIREGISILLKPLDRWWQHKENEKIQKAKASKLPLIIILGGSRSGTTILYQTLAHYLPVSYFNNLSASFPRSPISSYHYFKKWFSKKKLSKKFRNYYGSVAGFNGPNDAFHIWNRWLGHDRNAIPSDIPESVKDEMRAFFNAWHQYSGKPFLNKNNRNSLCVDLFLETFENIHFVEIRRNPLFVVQSLIQSREIVQGDKHIGWGLGTNGSSNPEDEYAYIKDICQQVKKIEDTLDEVRTRVPKDQYSFIQYEDFCSDPQRFVLSIYSKVWTEDAPALNMDGFEPLNNTNHQKLPDREFQMIESFIKELYAGSEHDPTNLHH